MHVVWLKSIMWYKYRGLIIDLLQAHGDHPFFLQEYKLLLSLSPFPILVCSSCLAASSAFCMSSMCGEWAWWWWWWCPPCGERCLTRALCPSLAWPPCVFVDELVLLLETLLLLLDWLWLRLLDPDTLPAMTIRTSKHAPNTLSKCSRFSAGIQYDVYTVVGNWSATANLLSMTQIILVLPLEW